MKKSLLVAGLMAVFGFAQGQQGYYFLKSKGTAAPYDLNAAGATTVTAAPSSGNLSAEQILPFAWNYYGQPVTKFKASTSGYITFDVTQTTDVSANTALPDASAPKNAIFAFWDDLKLQTVTSGTTTFPSDIRTVTYGTAPNRVFVIQWRLTQASATSGKDVTYFAIRLYEGDKFDIIHNYGFGTFSATTGISNADGSQGIMIGASPNLPFGGNNGSYDATLSDVYTFTYGNLPDYNASVTSLNLKSFYGKNATVPVAGTLVNIGGKAINSLKLNYKVDNGAVVTQDITGLNLAPNGAGVYNFTHNTNYQPTAEGSYNLTVWASDFNGGNADGDTTNDKKSGTINIIVKSLDRTTLHEIFTSATCGPCVAGNINQKNIVDQKTPGTYATVKYQQDFPGTGDPYATTETIGRRNFYAINSIPRMEIDGGWNGNANSLTSAIFDQYQQIPSAVEIEASYVVYDKTIAVNVKATSYMDLPANSKIFVAVCEKQTTQNVRTNGETEFEHVVKKMLPNQNGFTVSSFKANTPVLYNPVYTFPGSYRLPADGSTANRINLLTENSVEEFTDLEVVVWVQNTTTKEVYQATNAKAFSLGVANKNAANGGVSIYPNPANNNAKLSFNLQTKGEVKIEVVNMLGQVVATQTSGVLVPGEQTIDFNTAGLESGAYMINIVSNDFSTTKQIVVSH